MLERSPSSDPVRPAGSPGPVGDGASFAIEASPEIRKAISGLGRTEDIVFSPDDRRLAVVDYVAEKVFIFAIRIDRSARVEPSATIISFCPRPAWQPRTA